MVVIIISLPKVIWEERCIAAMSHMYAVKSPLVTFARPKFPQKYPFPWTNPQTPLPDLSLDPSDLRCQTASGSHLPFFHNGLDRQIDWQTDGPTDRPWESLTTIGRYATRATGPNNNNSVLPLILHLVFSLVTSELVFSVLSYFNIHVTKHCEYLITFGEY